MAEACINKEKTQQFYSSAVDSSSTNDTLTKPSGPSSSLTNQSKDGGVTRDPVTNHLHIDGVDRGQQGNSANAPEFSSKSELDDNDALIGDLRGSGYSEEELMDGYFESRIVDLRAAVTLRGRERIWMNLISESLMCIII